MKNKYYNWVEIENGSNLFAYFLGVIVSNHCSSILFDRLESLCKRVSELESLLWEETRKRVKFEGLSVVYSSEFERIRVEKQDLENQLTKIKSMVVGINEFIYF